MSPYDPKFFDLLLKKYKDRFLLIIYASGYAGHLVSRIIRSSHQYYSTENDPLKFPDSTEGFPVVTAPWLDFKTQHLASVHQNDGEICWPWTQEKIKKNYSIYLNILKTTDYHLNIMTHQFSREEKYPKIKRIRIFGNLDDSYRDRRLIDRKEVKPSNNKSIYNLNINKLLSEDYDEFEEEYLKLTWSFNLDCKINSVRSFILLWREKQKRLGKYH